MSKTAPWQAPTGCRRQRTCAASGTAGCCAADLQPRLRVAGRVLLCRMRAGRAWLRQVDRSRRVGHKRYSRLRDCPANPNRLKRLAFETSAYGRSGHIRPARVRAAHIAVLQRCRLSQGTATRSKGGTGGRARRDLGGCGGRRPDEPRPRPWAAPAGRPWTSGRRASERVASQKQMTCGSDDKAFGQSASHRQRMNVYCSPSPSLLPPIQHVHTPP